MEEGRQGSVFENSTPASFTYIKFNIQELLEDGHIFDSLLFPWLLAQCLPLIRCCFRQVGSWVGWLAG